MASQDEVRLGSGGYDPRAAMTASLPRIPLGTAESALDLSREGWPENPVVARTWRGTHIESVHRGAWVLVDTSGAVVDGVGDWNHAVFARSSTKSLQALPLVETGAAERFAIRDDELALALASHHAEEIHVRRVRELLARLGLGPEHLQCGAQLPTDNEARRVLTLAGEKGTRAHNNCSGKHAGMLALAAALGVARDGYVNLAHPVQQQVARVMGEMCDADVLAAPCGVDGCSVPTWAIALKNLAVGFARFAAPDFAAARRIIDAVRAHPFMVAGSGDFDTLIMEAVPRVFVKTGAEGVYCAAVPHAGLGIALKVDDGAARAAEVGIATVLAALDVWTAEEQGQLQRCRHHDLVNWRKLPVGELRGIDV